MLHIYIYDVSRLRVKQCIILNVARVSATSIVLKATSKHRSMVNDWEAAIESAVTGGVHIQGVSGGTVNILGGGIMDYSE